MLVKILMYVGEKYFCWKNMYVGERCWWKMYVGEKFMLVKLFHWNMHVDENFFCMLVKSMFLKKF